MRDEVDAVLLARVVDRHDVAVVERGRGLRLAQEQLDRQSCCGAGSPAAASAPRPARAACRAPGRRPPCRRARARPGSRSGSRGATSAARVAASPATEVASSSRRRRRDALRDVAARRIPAAQGLVGLQRLLALTRLLEQRRVALVQLARRVLAAGLLDRLRQLARGELGVAALRRAARPSARRPRHRRGRGARSSWRLRIARSASPCRWARRAASR